ncbi:MAG: hypothetical protein LW865_15700 [Betaproteobacteria bacterium]|jgi:hypothetical protein|nr:hypothetical protein [Betaproteobacteria bacterium]
MTAAISAVRRQVREMVDGTLEIKLHVSPVDKAAFHQLFPEIDMPVALAPLNPKALTPAGPEKDKPGPLCMLAVNWCKDEKFQRWICRPSQFNPIPEVSAGAARQKIITVCGVESRRELDTNDRAAMRFQELIRLPYMSYLNTGVVK